MGTIRTSILSAAISVALMASHAFGAETKTMVVSPQMSRLQLDIVKSGQPGGARKKATGTVHGCGYDELNTPGGKACMNKLDNDVMTNQPVTHNLFCGPNGNYCCAINNTTGKVTDCQAAMTSNPTKGVGNIPKAGTLQRK